jgi:hypothetical protein
MATTTNYGWTTPDDTALVKDGAAAIRTLGSSVDTTTKALNPSTTLGDIEYRSSTANTNTRLGIGTTGQVLSVTGGVPAWSTISAGGMTLLSTTSLSGASTDITSISQDYTQLYVLLQDVYGNASIDRMKFTFNSDTTAANYYSNMVMGENTTTSIEATVSNGYFGNGVGSEVNTQIKKLNGFIKIDRYTTAGTKFIELLNTSIKGTSSFYRMQGGGIYIGAAVTSVAVGVTGGTMSGGTAYVYGVK